MKMKKKVLAFAVILTTALMLTGCKLPFEVTITKSVDSSTDESQNSTGKKILPNPPMQHLRVLQSQAQARQITNRSQLTALKY